MSGRGRRVGSIWGRMLSVVAVTVALALVAGACAASGDEDAESTETSEQTDTSNGGEGAATYGDLTEVCGPGDFTIEASQAGRGTDKLYVGVATDQNSAVRPGLNKEMWDASLAFVEWCNEHGGIGGLQIEPVEISGALFDVEAGMTTACTDVFAMVGGGFAQDNLEFSGKEGSDFHLCDLVAIPGYAVSPEKADSNGLVQPIPNTGTGINNTWIRDFAELEPETASRIGIAYAELPALEYIKDKYAAAVEDVGLELTGEFPYSALGMTDWTPLAQQIIRSGATTLLWVGEAGFLTALLAKLKEQRWTGTPLLETNMYDPLLFSLGDEVAEGAVIRTGLHPLEEADLWPAVDLYLDTLDRYVEDFRTGPLGQQATSAWLLFAVAAKQCAQDNDGVLERECVLAAAADQSDWTGGGMHGPTDPEGSATAEVSPCGMLLVVRDGAYERLYPEIGGENDDAEGFHCPPDGTTLVPEKAGLGKVDPDRPL